VSESGYYAHRMLVEKLAEIRVLREMFFLEWSMHTGVHPDDRREAFDSWIEAALAELNVDEREGP